jgi:hypothetical protein
MLVCLTKSKDVLFLSKDGVYTHTVGPLDAAALAPVYDWLRSSMEFAAYFEDERSGNSGTKTYRTQKYGFAATSRGYDMRPIESAMSRSVAFFQADHLSVV